MQKENTSPTELWRWKMIRKVADDINMSELKAMIESYRHYHDFKGYIPSSFNQ